jgi:hypothetical protein
LSFGIAALGVAAAFGASPARAADVTTEWSSIQMPPPPQLKPATVDPKTTALLLFDFMDRNCNAKDRPRCLTVIPALKKLDDEARAAGMLVAYTLPGGGKAKSSTRRRAGRTSFSATISTSASKATASRP